MGLLWSNRRGENCGVGREAVEIVLRSDVWSFAVDLGSPVNSGCGCPIVGVGGDPVPWG